MKVLLKTTEENQFQITDIDKPVIQENEVLVKVAFCGICGSDVHAANHATGYEFVPMPIVLGHEFAGKVVNVGQNVDQQLLDQEVVVVPGYFCGQCAQCKDGEFAICEALTIIGLHENGGMAEYVKCRKEQIIPITSQLPLALAALTEPLSVAVHAVERMNHITKTQKIFVQGCGIIGVFTAFLLKERGHDVLLSGLQKDWEHRLQIADSLGIPTVVVDGVPNDKSKYDIVFECSGSAGATEAILKKINKNGSLVLVALYDRDLEVNLNELVRSQKNIVCSYGSNLTDFHQAISFIASHQVDLKKLIKIYPLREGQTAFDEALAQKVLKPIIQTNESLEGEIK